jgi:hypothetical protein
MLLALAAAVACGDSSTSPAEASGTYTLQSVNGSPLPFTLSEVDATKFEITSDQLALNDDGTWTEAGLIRTTQNGQVTTGTLLDAGTYTLTGTALTLVSNQFGPSNGSLDNGTLTLAGEGLVLLYQK